MAFKPHRTHRIIVAGSRGFTDYGFLAARLTHLIARLDCCNTEIVSGTARGADQLGERYAYEHGFELARFPADWEQHGRSAGYRRNEIMADYATHLVAFWDGASRGTKHMIDTATTKGLVVRIIRYDLQGALA